MFQFILRCGDLTDSMNITPVIQKIQHDDIYNLATMSHMKVSSDGFDYTASVGGIGTLRILEAVSRQGLTKEPLIYKASISERYNLINTISHCGATPFYPRSLPVAKLYSYGVMVNYCKAYNVFACNGILFKHESPLWGEPFVT